MTKQQAQKQILEKAWNVLDALEKRKGVAAARRNFFRTVDAAEGSLTEKDLVSLMAKFEADFVRSGRKI